MTLEKLDALKAAEERVCAQLENSTFVPFYYVFFWHHSVKFVESSDGTRESGSPPDSPESKKDARSVSRLFLEVGEVILFENSARGFSAGLMIPSVASALKNWRATMVPLRNACAHAQVSTHQ